VDLSCPQHLLYWQYKKTGLEEPVMVRLSDLYVLHM
jgi:hypothetical protein